MGTDLEVGAGARPSNQRPRTLALVALAVIGVVVGLGTGPAGASGRPTPARAVLTLGGSVDHAVDLSLDDLAARPQVSASVEVGERGRTVAVSGVSLHDLVLDAHPVLPDAKNALLRVVVTADGAPGSVAFALGELDAAFGDHDAIVVTSVDGRALPFAALVVPGDRDGSRALWRVKRLTVGVAAARSDVPSAPGLPVASGSRWKVVSPRALAALPTTTRTVSFLAGTTPQTHVETGPTLTAVLRAAGIRVDATTWVAAVGSDGYVAVVTPSEATTGGRPLLLSTVEDGVTLLRPRLVVDGDVKGGRFVSGVVQLVVGRGAPPSGASAASSAATDLVSVAG